MTVLDSIEERVEGPTLVGAHATYRPPSHDEIKHSVRLEYIRKSKNPHGYTPFSPLSNVLDEGYPALEVEHNPCQTRIGLRLGWLAPVAATVAATVVVVMISAMMVVIVTSFAHGPVAHVAATVVDGEVGGHPIPSNG